MAPSFRWLVPVVVLLTLPLAAFAETIDWPHPRGPRTDGTLAAPGTFDGEGVGLEVAWRVALGSGYSGIAGDAERVYTAFSEGDGNWIAAFDAGSGKQVWKHRLGPIYKGHDGSDDGPLSSPVVGDGKVYAIDPRGRLAALGASDGTVVWEKDLAGDFGAAKPDFGFTTTPLLDGGRLIVQAGGSGGRSLVALDAASGETRWTHGDGGVDYQSPSLMTLGGRRQAVAVSSTGITGIALEDGAQLWHHPFGEGQRSPSAVPTHIGGDRFLLYLGGGATAFDVAESGGGWSVSEAYQSDALGRTYAPPVYHDGHVYGFRGSILNCMKAADGERVWRSRPPGGDGLILVDGNLVIFGAGGNVVIADASPEGYRERARVQALDSSSLTWPAFAAGKVYVRNLDELAAVRIETGVDAATTRTAESAAPEAAGDHAFGRWLEKTRAADSPAAEVEAFLAKHPRWPLVDGEHVTFLWHGEADEVAIRGTMLDGGDTEALERLDGTHLFYKTYTLPPGGRWEYRLQADFGDWVTDSRNPRTAPGGGGEVSEVVTEGYPEVAHLGEPEGPRGTVETFELTSDALGETKEITVWLPPGYGEGEERYPLLVVSDGEAWHRQGRLVTALDNLVGERVAPLIVAFVPATGAWWEEAGGAKNEENARMLAHELVPALAARYRIADKPASRALLANQYFGLNTAYTALRHADVFGAAAIQSPSLSLGAGPELEAMIAERKGDSVRFVLDWSQYDARRRDRGHDFGEDAEKLARMLEEAGYDVMGGEVLDSAGWGGWSARVDDLLETLFPATSGTGDPATSG